MRPTGRGRVHDAAGVDLSTLLVDGDNLLHRVRGSRDEGGLRWLLPRLRAWRPPGVEVLVMLDGHPDIGEALRRRVAVGIEFRHAGSVSADDALLAVLAARPYADRAATVLVTDDHALADRARHAGGVVRRIDWLTAQLADAPWSATGPSVGVGRGRPQSAGADSTSRNAGATKEGDERPPWRPGRGATHKHGNPRRRPKPGPGRRATGGD